MKNDIQEHYDSIQFKKALQELHIANVSELKEYNCVALANKLRTGYNKLMIIRKLNDLGYLPSAENAISIHDIPMSRKIRNIFLKNVTIHSRFFGTSKKSGWTVIVCPLFWSIDILC